MRLIPHPTYFEIVEINKLQFLGNFIQREADKLISTKAQFLFQGFYNWRKRVKHIYTHEVTYGNVFKENKFNYVEYKLVLRIRKTDNYKEMKELKYMLRNDKLTLKKISMLN